MDITLEQQHVIHNIRFLLDVDFIPEPDDVYAALPEPFRSRSLLLLTERRILWNKLVADKLKAVE